MRYDIYDNENFLQMERVPREIAARIVGVPEQQFRDDMHRDGVCIGRSYVAKCEGLRKPTA